MLHVSFKKSSCPLLLFFVISMLIFINTHIYVCGMLVLRNVMCAMCYSHGNRYNSAYQF